MFFSYDQLDKIMSVESTKNKRNILGEQRITIKLSYREGAAFAPLL